VNEADCVDVILKPGQASLHHGHLFHSSGPNRSDDRRMGIAIRYIKPSMKQQTDDRPLVTLASGEDNFGHFTIAGAPQERMSDYDFAQCQNDAELKRRTIINDAKKAAG
jgi:ectoine hydroxylase-related dioxygenase (phytanoyl-CoA dioxygenase family)